MKLIGKIFNASIDSGAKNPLELKLLLNPELKKTLAVKKEPDTLYWRDDKSWNNFAKGDHPTWKDLLEFETLYILKYPNDDDFNNEKINKIGNIIYSTYKDVSNNFKQNYSVEVFRYFRSSEKLISFFKITKDESLALFDFNISPFPEVPLPVVLTSAVFRIKEEDSFNNLKKAVKNLSELFNHLQKDKIYLSNQKSFISDFKEAVKQYSEALKNANIYEDRVQISISENNIFPETQLFNEETDKTEVKKGLDEHKKLSQNRMIMLPTLQNSDKGFIDKDEAALVYIAVNKLERSSEIEDLVNTGLDNIPHKFKKALEIINVGYYEIKNDDKEGYHIVILKKDLPIDYSKIKYRIQTYLATKKNSIKQESANKLIELINQADKPSINKLICFKAKIAIFKKDSRLNKSILGKSKFQTMLKDIEKQINEINSFQSESKPTLSCS